MTGRLETRARLRNEALPDIPYDVWKRMRTLDQRARYPDDWHPHEYFRRRVRLFAWLAAIGLGGAVAWMVVG